MNLLIPAAAVAATLAATAVFQPDETSYRWVTGEIGCAALLDGPGPDRIGPISALVEPGMRDEPYLIFSAWSAAWPLRQDEQYALDIGLDGAPPSMHVAQAGSHQDGTITFELGPELRTRLRGARSIELYRDGRLIDSVPAEGLADTLDDIEACAAAEPYDVAVENGVSIDDAGTNMDSLTPEELEALEAAERALDATSNAVEIKPD